jgi:hypothetical protein
VREMAKVTIELEGRYLDFLLDMIKAARTLLESQDIKGVEFKVKVED